jgi:hypothetical protein
LERTARELERTQIQKTIKKDCFYLPLTSSKKELKFMKLEQYYGEHIANYPEYLTQLQVCEMCKLSKKTVYKLERSGKLPYTVEVNHLIHTHKIWIMDVLKYLYEKE